jgi:D-alanyl-D-alanine carboxypeptidase
MNWVRRALISIAAVFAVASAASAEAQGRYASIIVDANRLDVLHARQIDAPHHPASLTKLMTLYLTFEALDAGMATLDQSVTVSPRAAATPPVSMGLKAGQSVRLDTLIQGVSVRSANDAAAVLAEALGGTEAAFVARMNAVAAGLGMRGTTFRNPHGLPDAAQITTARDMAKLSVALLERFPHHYHYFGQTHFRGARNTNALLKRADVDGFKTGYTRASGYNLVISAIRGEDRIVAVVLGGASSGSRNSHMADLIDRGFEVIGQTRPETRPDSALITASTAPTGPAVWALQIDGFDSVAEAAILAHQRFVIATQA